MPAAKFTDEEFISAWGRGGGSPVKVATILGTKERAVYKMREQLAQRGIILKSVPTHGPTK